MSKTSHTYPGGQHAGDGGDGAYKKCCSEPPARRGGDSNTNMDKICVRSRIQRHIVDEKHKILAREIVTRTKTTDHKAEKASKTESDRVYEVAITNIIKKATSMFITLAENMLIKAKSLYIVCTERIVYKAPYVFMDSDVYITGNVFIKGTIHANNNSEINNSQFFRGCGCVTKDDAIGGPIGDPLSCNYPESKHSYIWNSHSGGNVGCGADSADCTTLVPVRDVNHVVDHVKWNDVIPDTTAKINRPCCHTGYHTDEDGKHIENISCGYFGDIDCTDIPPDLESKCSCKCQMEFPWYTLPTIPETDETIFDTLVHPDNPCTADE